MRNGPGTTNKLHPLQWRSNDFVMEGEGGGETNNLIIDVDPKT